MKVITVTGGRENKEFFKKLDEFDDSEYDLVNICTTHSGRFIAFLKQKPEAARKAKSKPEIKGKI